MKRTINQWTRWRAAMGGGDGARPDLVSVNARRVALAATGIVAATYLLIAVSVVLIVTHNLTANIDTGLQQALSFQTAQQPPPDRGGGLGEPPGQTRFAAPVLCWRVRTTGEVFTCPGATNTAVPSNYATISGPTTISLSGTEVRVSGTRAADGDYILVGQSLDAVNQARSNLIVAELLVGPLLLVAVFLGALTIGRRVARPIESVRQRQLEFTANASHELRTPLAVIEAQANLALARDRDAAWYRAAFQRVDREGTRMRRLVEDLLWLARMDATQDRAKADPVDVGVMAEQAVDRFATIAEARRIRLTMQLAGRSHVIGAPPEWIDHLLGVLLDNACKYAPQDGAVDVRVTADNDRVRLKIDDSGPGIPPEDRRRVFERFRRATEQPGGAGLGLAIADAVVKGTGGRWEIGTSPLGGASMAVSWPRLMASSRDSASAPAAPRPAPSQPQP